MPADFVFTDEHDELRKTVRAAGYMMVNPNDER